MPVVKVKGDHAGYYFEVGVRLETGYRSFFIMGKGFLCFPPFSSSGREQMETEFP